MQTQDRVVTARSDTQVDSCSDVPLELLDVVEARFDHGSSKAKSQTGVDWQIPCVLQIR